MQAIYLDISNKGVIPYIHAKQGEVGRKFTAIITDNGEPYNVPDTSLLSVWYESDTDAGNYSSIGEKSAFSVDGNKITVELVAQMLLKPGNGSLCLSITHAEGGEISTWNIPYRVEFKPGAGSSVPTEYYTALTEAASKAAEQVALAGEQAAAAKEYADEAAKSAQQAESSASQNMSALANIIAPVGYVFTWNPVDGSKVDLSTAEKVAAHFGFGTWKQIKDRFILAAGDFYDAGEVGGEESHTLTISEMPSHNHYVPNIKTTGATDTGGAYAESWGGGTGTRELSTEATGEGEPFDIMPPYMAFYVWQRIA